MELASNNCRREAALATENEFLRRGCESRLFWIETLMSQ